jgi:putative transposase
MGWSPRGAHLLLQVRTQCLMRSGRTPSGAGTRRSALKRRPRKRPDPPESPALVELDACSRRVAGWSLGDSLAVPLVTAAFERAVHAWSAPPGLHHSDRGGQYASAEFRRLLARHGSRPSMSRPACPYDNAVMESFFATLKTECFGDHVPRNRAEAQALLFDYIETFYNPQRLHSALGYRSPLEFETHLTQSTNHRN